MIRRPGGQLLGPRLHRDRDAQGDPHDARVVQPAVFLARRGHRLGVLRPRIDHEDRLAALLDHVFVGMTADEDLWRTLIADANRDATQELREAEARGTRLLEQARHQATELTNSARAEVEQTLEWARAQASTVLARAHFAREDA